MMAEPVSIVPLNFPFVTLIDTSSTHLYFVETFWNCTLLRTTCLIYLAALFLERHTDSKCPYLPHPFHCWPFAWKSSLKRAWRDEPHPSHAIQFGVDEPTIAVRTVFGWNCYWIVRTKSSWLWTASASLLLWSGFQLSNRSFGADCCWIDISQAKWWRWKYVFGLLRWGNL